MIAFVRRLKSLLPASRRAQETDMQEEFAALEQFASRKELGNLTRAAEQARAVVGFPLLEGLCADLRYACRSLRRDKAFTAVALVSLAIGMAGNLAVFGLMDALLWRQLPIRAPEQLVAFENSSRSWFGYSELARRAGKALEDVLAQSSAMPANVGQTAGADASGEIAFVSGSYFRALGVDAQLGRGIESFDDDLQRPAAAVVLSNGYWRRAFGGRADVVGKALYIGKGKFEVVGVAPAEFFGLVVGESPDVWLRLTAYGMVFRGDGRNWLTGKDNNWLEIFGRLRPGVNLRRAEAMLTPISAQIDVERSGIAPSEGDRLRLLPASKGISALRERFSRPLQIVFAMLGIGLFLACVNVVSLQIARSDESRKEFSIRLAIGAGRFRMARQCLVEMLVVSIASTGAALLAYHPLAKSMVSIMTAWGNLPAYLELRNFYFDEGNGRERYEIVGVVTDVKSDLRESGLVWYLAATQHAVHPFSTCFLVRTRQPQPAVLAAARSALHDEDNRLRIANAASAEELFMRRCKPIACSGRLAGPLECSRCCSPRPESTGCFLTMGRSAEETSAFEAPSVRHAATLRN